MMGASSNVSARPSTIRSYYLFLMGGLKKSGVDINRKMLAELAISDPAAFQAVVATATQQ